MLFNRITQFREYNKLTSELIAKLLGIEEKEYLEYESGKKTPSSEIISTLADLYKVTVDEFYGYTPHLVLHSKEYEDILNDSIDESTLKMSNLSWEERELILYYRRSIDKENIIKCIENSPTLNDDPEKPNSESGDSENGKSE